MLAGSNAGFADGVGVATRRAGHDRGVVGGEVGDGGVAVVADAVGAAPVPGGGGVGVVTGDGGVAALAAAEDVDAAGQAVLGGVEVFEAYSGHSVEVQADYR